MAAAPAVVQRADVVVPTLLGLAALPEASYGIVLSAGWDLHGNFAGWVGWYDDHGAPLRPTWRIFAQADHRRNHG